MEKGVSQMNYLTKEDLLSLVENQAFENLQVEFKTYSFDNGKIGGREKDDLVKEIVAFANSEGGNIIIGIDEDGKRMASKLVDANCTVSDFDGIQLALQQYMLAKIRPRLFGVKMHSIVVNENKIAIVITVPKSYSRPRCKRWQQRCFLFASFKWYHEYECR